jgi:flagellar biosynthesis protein FlhF
MNVKRFFGRNSREAMQKVRQAFGDNAVVLSTKPSSTGIEIVAMPAESIDAIERFEAPEAAASAAAPATPVMPALPAAAAVPAAPAPSGADAGTVAQAQVQDDIGTLAMSTLSFQDYVRERMLKKRQAELRAQESVAEVSLASAPAMAPTAASADPGDGYLSAAPLAQPARSSALETRYADWMEGVDDQFGLDDEPAPEPVTTESFRAGTPVMSLHDEPPVPELARGRAEPRAESRMEPRVEPAAMFADLEAPVAPPPVTTPSVRPAARMPEPEMPSSSDVLSEIRAMKGMIEERFGAMAFMDRLQTNPKQAQLTTRLLDAGFSPALIRKLSDSLPDDVGDEMAWAAEVLQRNLMTSEHEPELEEQGGVYAMIGSTGVGKTTSTAKLATAFATRHGAANLGLITLDAYRVGAHEQLRAYGRILGVPVHTAHDRAALEDLLDLLSGKKMVLIDTAGLAQRDARTRDLLDMLSHRSIKRLLVVNAAQQGETIEDVLHAYSASQARGIVLSKLDEAVKLGPALDAMIRNRLKVLAVANGQRVPEDWHRMSAHALMSRALKGSAPPAWRLNTSDVNLIFARPTGMAHAPARRAAAAAPRELGL